MTLAPSAQLLPNKLMRIINYGRVFHCTQPEVYTLEAQASIVEGPATYSGGSGEPTLAPLISLPSYDRRLLPISTCEYVILMPTDIPSQIKKKKQSSLWLECVLGTSAQLTREHSQLVYVGTSQWLRCALHKEWMVYSATELAASPCSLSVRSTVGL